MYLIQIKVSMMNAKKKKFLTMKNKGIIRPIFQRGHREPSHRAGHQCHLQQKKINNNEFPS